MLRMAVSWSQLVALPTTQMAQKLEIPGLPAAHCPGAVNWIFLLSSEVKLKESFAFLYHPLFDL